MKSKNYSAIAIPSFLAVVLITVATVTGVSTTSFEDAFAQGENMTGMSQDQTSTGGGGGGESMAFNPEEIIKKEARGLGDDADLGEVQEISGEFIVTQKGTVDKDVYYIPKNLVDHFDGSTVFFTVTEEEVKQYKRD
jgi:hypothetical protein